MNSERFLRLADAVEAEQADGQRVVLDMRTWHGHDTCGTTACIGGFCDLILRREQYEWSRREVDDFIVAMHRRHASNPRPDIMIKAASWLDLNDLEARELMTTASYFDLILHFRGTKVVPDALRWMAATGKVDWLTALKAAECANMKSEQ